MEFTLHIWRQKNPETPGKLMTYQISGVTEDMSFIEMLEMLNRQLVEEGRRTVPYDCDCLEGICGACSLTINGIPHGKDAGITTCQVYMRNFNDGDHITIEPFRAKPFRVIKDLVIDRSSFDRIIQAGGFISANAGSPPDANALLIPKDEADIAMDAAQCIGCGACVAACKNASAMLFVAAKIGHLRHLPQGQPEKLHRAREMVRAMDEEGFGGCTNQYECEAACPKEISVRFIAEMNRDYWHAAVTGKK